MCLRRSPKRCSSPLALSAPVKTFLSLRVSCDALGPHRSTDAAKALSLTQLDGRTLVIEASRVSKKTASSSKRQTKLIVRNLAFAASVGDVRDLFRTFGPLKNVRVPKRYDGRARGFAFVEYERASDAASARRALGAAHLYGRHLVIDWADNEGVS